MSINNKGENMKKKILVTILGLLIILSLGACEHEHDHIQIYNKTDWVFDDIDIDVKNGYFYEDHEKFIIDDNTIAVTVYFTNKSEEEKWEKREEN